jgi:hypothetical protein
MGQKCYGRLAPKIDSKTPQFRRYMLAAAAALAIPAQILYYQAVAQDAWPMYDNDRIGCCTAAATGHMIQCGSANANGLVTPTDAQILKCYEDVSGYDPQTGANDDGAAETDVLSYWQKTGVGGNKLDSWAAVDPSNFDHLRLGTWYFGGVYLGLTVTSEAEQQFDQGQPWQRGWFNRPVGQHAVPLLGFDHAAEILWVSTWGKIQAMTYDYWHFFGSEAYVPVNSIFVKSSGVNPVGLNLDQMRADQSLVAA